MTYGCQLEPTISRYSDQTVQLMGVRSNPGQFKNDPGYDATLAIDRAYQQSLHDAHNRKGYWI